MSLVDLRGRETEPGIRALLAYAHGSTESLERAVVHYGQGQWILIGWEEDGDVVACAGVERRDDRTLVLHSVAVAPHRREPGIGRALLDGLGAVATASELVAETDSDAAGFYARCGFRVERIASKGGQARFRCVRSLEPRPGSLSDVGSFTLGELEQAIRTSWDRDTSEDPDEWSPENRARGQCAATARVVRDLLGGEILLANVLRDGQRVERHAWNRLPSGVAIDLTRSQFIHGEELEAPSVGEPLVSDSGRYERLATRVRERLGL